MPFQVILAHGALGPFDELIMLGVGAIFLVMMGVSWVRSRNTRPDFELQETQPAKGTDEGEPIVPPDQPQSDAPDRFRLD